VAALRDCPPSAPARRLADLGTYCRIQATTALNEKYLFTLHTRPTPIQQRAFELLAINPDRTQ
jgi:hypothetical protein